MPNEEAPTNPPLSPILGLGTIVTPVDKKGESLRLTLPAPVAALLGVMAGDELVWIVEPGSGRISVKLGETVRESKRV